ncbi:MAG: hypothetical protein JWO38_5795 [Gemmataceae bacterium]|nr:hypothetical protein [Gemmataceae bacterium]
MFVSGAAEKLAAIGIKCLAVAGGFLAGYAIGGATVWALDRWVLAQKAPDFLKKSVRVVAGVAAALLVAFIVFGDGTGGGWFGGGGGSGDGNGTNPSQSSDPGKQNDQSTPPVKQPDPKTTPKLDTPKTPDVRPEDPRVRVTFLGGDAVQGDRFYLLDDDPSPKTFDELKKAVMARKEGTPRPMFLLVQFPGDPRQRIDENSINVTQVTSWARNVAGVQVVWPGKK